MNNRRCRQVLLYGHTGNKALAVWVLLCDTENKCFRTAWITNRGNLAFPGLRTADSSVTDGRYLLHQPIHQRHGM